MHHTAKEKKIYSRINLHQYGLQENIQHRAFLKRLLLTVTGHNIGMFLASQQWFQVVSVARSGFRCIYAHDPNPNGVMSKTKMVR